MAEINAFRPDGASGVQPYYVKIPTGPRRCPATTSVSLREPVKGLKRPTSTAFVESSNASPSIPAQGTGMDVERPAPHQNQISSASNWFDNANANVDTHRANPLDHDPPFYLGPRGWERGRFSDSAGKTGGWVGNGFASGLLQREDSENGDLRSVIDDLTIENKKLKQRLQRFERSYNPDLQQDKLFEVRINGLSGQKKRELEGLLRGFISTLNRPSTGLPFSPKPERHTLSSKNPRSIVHSHSHSQLADSAYASMSQSWSGSIGQSNQEKVRHGPSIAVKDRNIRSYLHDISKTVLPHNAPALTENAKMKEIVKRLEQLFTGKVAAPGEHSFPNQQQEVSQSAAHADAVNKGTVGKHPCAEGNREALIMSHDSKPATERFGTKRERPQAGHDLAVPALHTQSSTDSSSEGNSPGQRPTRPLDLDIHRAQIPSENIEYIRHLGLSPPTLKASPSCASQDGWVYLNLLISMAQLHTINVTPEFIRKALAEKSSNFELSGDGRKVRWKGGIGGTHLSSDSSSAEPASDESPIDVGIMSENGINSRHVRDYIGFTSKPVSESTFGTKSYGRNSSMSGTNGSGGQLGSLATIPTTVDNKFDYKPLFYNGGRSEYDDEHGLGEGDSMYSSSGHRITAAGLETESDTFGRDCPVKNRDNGPIIFYHNSTFCADLSGDSLEQLPNIFPVSRDGKRILGVEVSHDEKSIDADEFKGPLVYSSIRPEAHEDSSAPPLQVFDGTVNSIPSPAPSQKQPLDFEASGIGGVLPTDNFALSVKVKRTPAIHQSSAHDSGPSKRRRYDFETASAQLVKLPPSNLPPPSFIFLPISSSSSDCDSILDSSSSDEDDDESMASGFHEQRPAPPSFLCNFSSEDNADASSNATNGSDDASSDSSKDLLKTARALDPESIASEEREFESSVNDPEELPAASSAPMTDGESGFSSKNGSPSKWNLKPMPSSWSRPMSRTRSRTGEIE